MFPLSFDSRKLPPFLRRHMSMTVDLFLKSTVDS